VGRLAGSPNSRCGGLAAGSLKGKPWQPRSEDRRKLACQRPSAALSEACGCKVESAPCGGARTSMTLGHMWSCVAAPAAN